MELLSKLAEQGIAYLLLALSLLANVGLFRELRNSTEKRIDDIKQSRDAILEPLRAIQQTVNLILSTLQTKKK